MRKRVVIVDEKFCFEQETQLTVHKTSVFFAGDGFLAYDPNGRLLFCFDSYGPQSHPNDQLLLMDPSGSCLLTLLRMRPSLHQRWEGSGGEKTEEQHPIFSVFRSSIIGRSSVLVQLYSDPGEEYQIEGSYSQRCCKIYSTPSDPSSRECVAEIKRKWTPQPTLCWGRMHSGSAFSQALMLLLPWDWYSFLTKCTMTTMMRWTLPH